MKQIANINYNDKLVEGASEEKKEPQVEAAKNIVTDKIHGHYWRVKQEVMLFLKEFGYTVSKDNVQEWDEVQNRIDQVTKSLY